MGAGRTLPAIEDIDITSYQLIQLVHRRRLRSIVSMRCLMQLWRAVGKSISASLLQGKGVRLGGLVLLTFDVAGRPMYALDLEPNCALRKFGSGHQVCWQPARTFLPDSDVPVLATLPYESVARYIRRRPHSTASRTMSRKQCEEVCKTIFSEFIRAARGSCSSVCLSVASVGELVYMAHSGRGYDDKGLGAAGWLGFRFRRALIDECRRQGAAQVIKRPVYRAELARKVIDDRPTIDDRLRSVPPKKLVSAPGIDSCAQCAAVDSLRSVDFGKRIVQDVKQRLVARYGILAIQVFETAFEALDDSGDGELDIDEMRWGLRDLGVEIDDVEAINLIHMLDRDQGGALSIQEFLDGVRGAHALSKRRMDQVAHLFNTLQRATGSQDSERIKLTTLMRFFNPWADTCLQSGLHDCSAEELAHTLVAALDRSEDGSVDYRDFLGLYTNISAAIGDNDRQFQHVVTSYWVTQPVSRPPDQYRDDQKPDSANAQSRARVDTSGSEDVFLDCILDSPGSKMLQHKPLAASQLTEHDLDRILDANRAAVRLEQKVDANNYTREPRVRDTAEHDACRQASQQKKPQTPPQIALANHTGLPLRECASSERRPARRRVMPHQPTSIVLG